MAKITTKDLETLMKGIQNIEKNIGRVAEDTLNEVTAITIAEAKKNTTVDSGLLRDSWYVTPMTVMGNTYSRSVKNDAKNDDGEYYAGYYEHGHRTRLGTSLNPLYKPKEGSKAWVVGRYPLLRATRKADARTTVIATKYMKKYFERN